MPVFKKSIFFPRRFNFLLISHDFFRNNDNKKIKNMPFSLKEKTGLNTLIKKKE